METWAQSQSERDVMTDNKPLMSGLDSNKLSVPRKISRATSPFSFSRNCEGKISGDFPFTYRGFSGLIVLKSYFSSANTFPRKKSGKKTVAPCQIPDEFTSASSPLSISPCVVTNSPHCRDRSKIENELKIFKNFHG